VRDGALGNCAPIVSSLCANGENLFVCEKTMWFSPNTTCSSTAWIVPSGQCSERIEELSKGWMLSYGRYVRHFGEIRRGRHSLCCCLLGVSSYSFRFNLSSTSAAKEVRQEMIARLIQRIEDHVSRHVASEASVMTSVAQSVGPKLRLE
jgi:hypothetical protein